MRVLHFVKTSVGASWALRQTRELVNQGLEVHVALPDGPLVAAYRKAGVVTHLADTALNLHDPLRNFERFNTIRELVGDVSPDILHTHFVANALALRFALGRNHPIRRIFQVPGPLHLEHPFFRSAEILSAGPADVWLASCEWTRQRYIRSGVSPSRLGLAYYGVDIPDEQHGRANVLRTEFEVSPDVPIVGNVAYFYPPKRYLGQRVGLKGHEDLIAAVDLAGREIPGLTCFLVGGPWAGADWYFERVKQLASKTKHARIIMTGYRSDVHNIYKDFDVAVHPSHSENVGGAVESLLHAVPTIATEVGGFPDLVRPGETGLLVPPRNPVALADAIATVLSEQDKAKRQAEVGRLRVMQLLDVQKNARDIEHYYAELQNSGLLTPDQ